MTEVVGTVLTPKCDYLLHHPRLMLMYEPCLSLWCMRFKRKYQYFNNLTHGFMDFDKVPGGSVSMPFSHMPNDLQSALKLNDNFGELELDGRCLMCL